MPSKAPKLAAIATGQGRRHRSNLDVECGRDRRVAEPGVVAQEDDQSLTLWQRRHQRRDLQQLRRRLHRLFRSFVSHLEKRPPHALACGIDDSSPEPCLQRAVTAKAASAADRIGETVLDRLERTLGITYDRTRHLNEIREAPAVHRLDLLKQAVVSHAHHQD